MHKICTVHTYKNQTELSRADQPNLKYLYLLRGNRLNILEILSNPTQKAYSSGCEGQTNYHAGVRTINKAFQTGKYATFLKL